MLWKIVDIILKGAFSKLNNYKNIEEYAVFRDC